MVRQFFKQKCTKHQPKCCYWPMLMNVASEMLSGIFEFYNLKHQQSIRIELWFACLRMSTGTRQIPPYPDLMKICHYIYWGDWYWCGLSEIIVILTSTDSWYQSRLIKHTDIVNRRILIPDCHPCLGFIIVGYYHETNWAARSPCHFCTRNVPLILIQSTYRYMRGMTQMILCISVFWYKKSPILWNYIGLRCTGKL